jgi:large subunit ribosomal protein L24
VVVISGKDKGARGRVLQVNPDSGRVLVEGVNRVSRHQSPQRFREAGIVEKEAPIPANKVMVLDPKTDAPTRVRMGEDKEGNKVRIAAKSGAVLDG